MVQINGAAVDLTVPFVGYKKSGNGSEWGCLWTAELYGDQGDYGSRVRAALN